jgi:hypothetical protein
MVMNGYLLAKSGSNGITVIIPHLGTQQLSTLHHTLSHPMSSLASIEAPVIPVEVGKEAVETTTQAVEVKDGETLTEEMLYPDRAILTSTFITRSHY